jgi:uncharacterized membrane protein
MSSIRMRDLGDRVRATYWYLPTLMTVLAAVSALVIFWIDQAIPIYLLQDKWYIFRPDNLAEARSVLTGIASVSLSVVGVVFSIILVPLSIAATQYGSIVLRSFLRDRGTQFVLGAYTSTTFYCLFLLLALRTAGSDAAVQFSVSIAIYMLIISLLMLLYFFHHVADSLQASSVIRQVSEELEEVIKQEHSLPHAKFDARRVEVSELHQKLQKAGGVQSTGEGYVRAIDYDKLVDFATKRKVVLNIKCLSGDFVSCGDQLLTMWPGQEDKQMISTVNHAYMLGKNRTLFQDTEYGITLIVIIAVRALSPAINDPYTPKLCLDRLGAALGMLAERATPLSYYLDRDDQIRILAEPIGFERLVDVAFNMIREYGRGNAEVLMHMLATIKAISVHTRSDEQRKELLKHAKLIKHDSRIGLPSKYDQQRVHETYEETLRAINQT